VHVYSWIQCWSSVYFSSWTGQLFKATRPHAGSRSKCLQGSNLYMLHAVSFFSSLPSSLNRCGGYLKRFLSSRGFHSAYLQVSTSIACHDEAVQAEVSLLIRKRKGRFAPAVGELAHGLFFPNSQSLLFFPHAARVESGRHGRGCWRAGGAGGRATWSGAIQFAVTKLFSIGSHVPLLLVIDAI
jgi:hypothetical protein